MLPRAPKDVGRLSDVLISALGAITGGEANRLKLQRVKSAVVVLIDGLGLVNLQQNSGHARNLTRMLEASGSQGIRCGFPSTTAVSLVSLGTGLRAGEHGILGYRVLDAADKPKNMLTGWENDEEARSWQPNETVFELAVKAGVVAHMVASPEYAATGFTALSMSGANFSGVADLNDRVLAAQAIAKTNGTICYLYFAELDQAAHRFGVDSKQWRETLEAIDSAIALLRGDFGVLVTADHGIVDVEVSGQIYLEDIPGFSDAASFAVGDPRALFAYGDAVGARTALQLAGTQVYAVTPEELIALGWIAPELRTMGKAPDLVIIAKPGYACYDRRTANPRSLAMVGQHGGISDEEMRVPLIRAGLFV